SATGLELTEYHLEAAIASVHAVASGPEDTDWGAIVSFYDRLMVIRPSPVIALNRAIAVAQLEGPGRGLEEWRAISEQDRMSGDPFHGAALGELEWRCGGYQTAGEHFRAALTLARNPMEQRFLEQRVAACEKGATLPVG